MDFQKQDSDNPSLISSGSEQERVTSKFLRVHISNDLIWLPNTSSTVKKALCLRILQKLKRARLLSSILTIFYRGTLESVLELHHYVLRQLQSTGPFVPALVRSAERIIRVSTPTSS